MIHSGLDFTRLARELRRMKQKYHAKVLSSDALYINWLRALDTEGLLPWYVWLMIPEFTYAGLAFSILFDIDPSEIIPANWDFDVELPDLDELLQGILAEINKLDWSEIYEMLKNLEEYIRQNFEDQYADQILEHRNRKARYSYTKFNQSYYDPPVIREALRATFFKLWNERYTLEQIKRDIDAMAESLKISPGAAQLIFNKISQVFYAQPSAMILGYGVLGRSFLGEPVGEAGERLAKLRMVTHELELAEWGGKTLDHAQMGLVLGLVPLGYGFLLPPESVMKKPILPEKYLPLTQYVYERGSKNIHKMSWNPFTFGNYNRPEEQQDYRKSERADQYMSLQLIRYQVERIVDPLIRQHESNPVKIRMYKNAALQLLSLPAKRHRWGYEAFRAMTEDELVDWWIRHWEAQGLSRDVLKSIYERLKRWLPEWRVYKTWLGRRVRETRYRLARLR